jgi:Flp pilus assembly protein TadD
MNPDLEKWIGTARDGPLLRHSLGLQYAKAGDHGKAIEHFSEAVARNPLYSAAWKGLAAALSEAGRSTEALQAYRSGIEAAQKAGDKQAEKEMRVFLRRLEKAPQPSGGTSPVRKA